MRRESRSQSGDRLGYPVGYPLGFRLSCSVFLESPRVTLGSGQAYFYRSSTFPEALVYAVYDERHGVLKHRIAYSTTLRSWICLDSRTEGVAQRQLHDYQCAELSREFVDDPMISSALFLGAGRGASEVEVFSIHPNSLSGIVYPPVQTVFRAWDPRGLEQLFGQHPAPSGSPVRPYFPADTKGIRGADNSDLAAAMDQLGLNRSPGSPARTVAASADSSVRSFEVKKEGPTHECSHEIAEQMREAELRAGEGDPPSSLEPDIASIGGEAGMPAASVGSGGGGRSRGTRFSARLGSLFTSGRRRVGPRLPRGERVGGLGDPSEAAHLLQHGASDKKKA